MYIKIINNKAKFLIELLLYCCLIISISSIELYYYIHKSNNYKNFLKLKKLQHAIYLARSEAINLGYNAELCPSHNLQNCSQDWTGSVIILTNTAVQPLHVLQLQFTDPTLRFKFFGNQTAQKITFLPNGLTNNNGNFCIDDSNTKQRCLYINKAGKVYIK